MHTHIHTHTLTYIHTHTLTHTYTCTHTHIHAYTHTHIHTYIHTYTHTHIHTPVYMYYAHIFVCILLYQEPGSLEDIPITFIDTLEQLEELQRKLNTVTEFAVDLEVGRE